MSLLWEKSPAWRWLVRRTRDSKPFFFTFAALCGVVPGVLGFCVMQATSSRSDQLESHLRRTARPESNVTFLPFFTFFLLCATLLHALLIRLGLIQRLLSGTCTKMDVNIHVCHETTPNVSQC
jgi:membrane protease YdiL (CAAX protease family)